MKIKIINPNITQSMTDSVARLARRVARPDTQVWAVSPETGPDSIRSKGRNSSAAAVRILFSCLSFYIEILSQ